MVEGGLIDVAHHKNNAKRALEETLEFERAIKVIHKSTTTFMHYRAAEN